MYGKMASGGQSDLERFRAQQNAVTDESLESTRRMVQMVEDSQSAGTKTIEMLEHQGEQLNRIETGLDNINADMKEAEKHLTGMEKWCGLCLMPWNRRKKVKDFDESKWETSQDGTVVKRQPGAASGETMGDGSKGPFIERITNDAREDEMEDNMQSVSNVLGNLKNMAADMGEEIGRQNKQLDKIDIKASGADVKIGVANKRTEKLLQ